MIKIKPCLILRLNILNANQVHIGNFFQTHGPVEEEKTYIHKNSRSQVLHTGVTLPMVLELQLVVKLYRPIVAY